MVFRLVLLFSGCVEYWSQRYTENKLAPVQPINLIKFLHATSGATSAFLIFRQFYIFKFTDKLDNVPIELTTICGRIFATIHTLPITPLKIHN